jgi:hypothetical protein
LRSRDGDPIPQSCEARIRHQTVVLSHGHLDITTAPVGARIVSGGREIGVTPASLELQPGNYDLQLQFSGFQSLKLPVLIEGNQTVSVSTNLVNLKFTQALMQAQQSAGRGDYNRAGESITLALLIEPKNPQALKLQVEYSRELALIQGAQAMAASRVSIEAEFERRTKSIEQSELFETHSWRFQTAYGSVRDAVRKAIPKASGRYTIDSEATLGQRSTLFLARSKGLTGNGRRCVVLVAEINQTESQVVVKFWDYIAPTKTGISIGAFLNLDKYTPVHPRYFNANQKQSVLDRRRTTASEFQQILDSEIKGKGGL